METIKTLDVQVLCYGIFGCSRVYIIGIYLGWHMRASPLTVGALGPLRVLSLTPTGGGQPHPFGVIMGHKQWRGGEFH